MRKNVLQIFLISYISFSATALGAGNTNDSIPQKTPQPLDIKVEFSPYGDTLELILEAIRNAQQEIVVASYSFTSKPIAVALLDAYNRGVKIFVVADKKANSGKYTATHFLSNHQIPVCLTKNYAIMHNKFMVIDNDLVQTGSFNYSAAAVHVNAENVIIIRNIDLAKQYHNEFVRLYNECTIQN